MSTTLTFIAAVIEFGSVIYGTQEKTAEQIKTAILCGFSVLDSATSYKIIPTIKEAIDLAKKEKPDIKRPLVIAKFNSNDFPNIEEVATKHDDELGFKADIVLLHSASNKLATLEDNDKETLRVYKYLSEHYKCKYIGVSNFNIHQLQILLDASYHPVLNSIEFSPFFQPKQLINFCQTNNILVVPYRLTSKNKIYDIKLNEEKIPDVTNKVLKWSSKKEMIPIISSTKEENMNSILQFESENLDDKTSEFFDSLDNGKSGATCMFKFNLQLEEYV
jgi:diketogulonate reductase-like aldo/keto reductase